MKILSYNIRGLGQRIKKKEIRELIKEFRIDFCCIQESKVSQVSNHSCHSVWWNHNFY
ncbi:hypothetical protein ACS0TY_032549 [Phlomoides rotata]